MKRLPFLTMLAALLASGQKPSAPVPADDFVGVWKLVSYERRMADGALTHPMGDKPVGRLTYDAAGHMTAQLMDPDRPKFRKSLAGLGSAKEKGAAFDGYTAYYGTYSVNGKDHVVIRHVEASLYPNWVGSEQRRLYEFSGGNLILRAVNGMGGPGTESRLVWERAR